LPRAILRAAIFSAASRVPATTVTVRSLIVTVQNRGATGFSSHPDLGPGQLGPQRGGIVREPFDRGQGALGLQLTKVVLHLDCDHGLIMRLGEWILIGRRP
jgi:hypothetical protein